MEDSLDGAVDIHTPEADMKPNRLYDGGFKFRSEHPRAGGWPRVVVLVLRAVDWHPLDRRGVSMHKILLS